MRKCANSWKRRDSVVSRERTCAVFLEKMTLSAHKQEERDGQVIVEKQAKISADGKYRYCLSRRWGHGNTVTFMMLNPSTADAEIDDPTIKKCMKYAQTWGFDGIDVINVYAYRATEPDELWQVNDPVGPENNQYIAFYAQKNAPIIAAWGANARPERVREIIKMIPADRLFALKINKDGSPAHPLYQKDNARPIAFGR